MTVLICPDKFKGSLSAKSAAKAIRRGVERALPDAKIDVQVLADGGEGSLELLATTGTLSKRRVVVSGPLRKPINATYLLGDGRAIIESSRACGLYLVPPARRHPKNTTTIGLGMLIEDALARGAQEITLLLGGSATNDGGAGMAAALGFRFWGARGEDFVPMADTLGWVARIDDSEKLIALNNATITAVCDVDSVLLGPHGATYTYAAQKGATPEDLAELEENMDRFARTVEKWRGRGLRHVEGSGAAGGLGFGALAFLGAELRRGTDVVFDAVSLRERAAAADLIITGEGKIDSQTLSGKVVAGVAALGKPTIAVCGRAEIGAKELGVDCILSIMDDPGITESNSLLQTAERLEALIYDYLTTTKLGL